MKKFKKEKKLVFLILFIIVILGIILIIKQFSRNNNQIVYTYNGWLYVNNKNNKLGRVDSNTILFSTNNKDFLYKIENDLYLYRQNKSKKITERVKEYYFSEDNNYIISLNIDNKLEVYNKKSLVTISDKVTEYLGMYKDNIYYIENSNIYKYNLKNKKNNKIIENANNSSIYKDKLIYITNDNILVYYNLKDEKKINSFDNAINFLYNSKNKKLAYLDLKGDLYFYNGKENLKIDNNVNIISYVKEFVIYAKIDNNNLNYYIANGKQKEKLTSLINQCVSAEKSTYCTSVNGTLYYINDNMKTSKISENVFSQLYSYENDFVYINTENDINNLYTTKESKVVKIDENVDPISIKINDDNLYYMKQNKKDLYLYNKKSKLLRENISDFYVINKKLYILKNYDEINLKGELYKYNNNKDKLILSEVTEVIE